MRLALKPALTFLGLAALAVACSETMVPTGPERIEPQFAKSPSCRMNLDLGLDETGSLRADIPLKHYIDKKEGVLVRSTGGLAFDTNTSGEIESPSDIRRVRVDLSGTDHAAHADPSETKGIELILRESSLGMELCDMAVGQSVTAQAVMTFVSSSTGVVRLAFGWNRADPGDDSTCEILHGSGVRLTVTRLPGNVWEFTSTEACFYDSPWGTVLLDTDTPTPYAMKFTITPK